MTDPDLLRRTAEVQAKAFRRAFQPLVDAAAEVYYSSRASARIDGERYMRVKASKLEELHKALREATAMLIADDQLRKQ